MRMKRSMKMLAAAMTAAMLCTGLTGCAGRNGGGGGGTSKVKPGKGATLEVSLDNSYASEQLDIQGIETFYAIYPIGDNILLGGYDQKSGTQCYALYDTASGTTRDIEFAFPKSLPEGAESYVTAFFVNADGNPCFLQTGYIWNDTDNEVYYEEGDGYAVAVNEDTPVVYNDDDQAGDEESVPEEDADASDEVTNEDLAADTDEDAASDLPIDEEPDVDIDDYSWEDSYQNLGYVMEIYDQDMNLIDTLDLSDKFTEETYFSDLVLDKDGNYLTTSWDYETGEQSFVIYDNDWNEKKRFEMPATVEQVERFRVDDAGQIRMIVHDADWNTAYMKLDPASGKSETVEIEGGPRWFNNAYVGKGEYDFFLNDGSSLYGVKFDSGVCEEVINWLNSDFTGDYINTIMPLEDGRFTISCYTPGYDANELWTLRKRTEEELDGVQLLSLATCYRSDTLTRGISQFNRTHDDYRIITMDYSKYNTDEDYELGVKKFEEDMTAGKVADLICVESLPFESYANKGLFMDQRPYVDKELNMDDYFTNFFDAIEYNGKLTRMGFSYSVLTLNAKTEHVDGKTGMDLNTFMQTIENAPAGMETFAEMTKDNALGNLCLYNLASFVDPITGECHFNSEEFIRLLELCNTYPEEGRNYEDMDDADWDAYMQEEYYQYINDKVLFKNTYISDIKQDYQDIMTYFDTADVTRVGYPTFKENSNGGRFNCEFMVSVASGTKYPDQCWEFISSMLAEDFQENMDWTLPVSIKAYDTMAAKAAEPGTTWDDEGNEVPETELHIWRSGEEEVTVPLMPASYADDLKAYIQGINETTYYNQTIYDIVQEEAGMFFSGDQTAKAAADMIQSRASLYLSEQS